MSRDTERVPAEIDNQRYVACWTNNDPEFQPLVILLPQWCKKSFDQFPIEKQRRIVDEFVEKVTDAWEEFMREE